jgi:methanethiol S-methyltransferase
VKASPGRRLPAHGIMALSVVCGAGSLVAFAGLPVGTLSVRMHWPEAGALCWDALLCFAFFLQHSGMVRRRFRARLAGVIPEPYHRAVYSIVSGVVLTSVVLLWQPSPRHLLALGRAFRWGARAGVMLAICVFIWGALAVRDFDFFGLGSIRAHLQGSTAPKAVFLIRGPYRWMRHTWYFGAIVLFWSCADLTADRILCNVLWTGWVCLGARLEEADLLTEFGDSYAQYRRQVPMFIPWRGPVAG